MNSLFVVFVAQLMTTNPCRECPQSESSTEAMIRQTVNKREFVFGLKYASYAIGGRTA